MFRVVKLVEVRIRKKLSVRKRDKINFTIR